MESQWLKLHLDVLVSLAKLLRQGMESLMFSNEDFVQS